MSPLRQVAIRAADEAEANLGVHEEGSSNWSPSVKLYLNSVGITSPAPWCAGFIYFRLIDASKDLKMPLPSFIPKSGYTPDWKNSAVKVKRWVPTSQAMSKKEGTYQVQKGDLALFYYSHLGRIGHIEVVDEVTAKGCWCIGGNTKTQDPNQKAERNGGMVARNFRRWGALGTQGGFFTLS